jgi:exodeoxyribonuclease VII large subunit
VSFRFDKEKAATPPRVYRVSEIVEEVSRVLRVTWNDVRVAGEISGLRRPASGHVYFDLKDDDSSLSAVLFRSDAARLRFRPEDGLEVVARGALGLYAARGQFQLQVVTLEPVGIGALQLAFEQMKKKLEAEGLFDPARKRPLPYLPGRIGIVTSPDGAAVRDILQVLGRRYENLRVTICPARVQGAGASEEIARGIRLLNRVGTFDVLIVARGGGSLEDLSPFNEEIVARALAASRIPTISAVGHETDVTIADLVADLRAPTPSAAAELVVGAKQEISRRVSQAQRLLLGASRARLAEARSRVAAASRAKGLLRFPYDVARLRARVRAAGERLVPAIRRKPLELHRRFRVAAVSLLRFPRTIEISRKKEGIGHRSGRLKRALRTRLSDLASTLASSAGKLATLDPLAILSRGYAVAYRENDRSPLKDASTVRRGDAVRVRLARGALRTRVAEIEGVDAAAPLPLFPEGT